MDSYLLQINELLKQFKIASNSYANYIKRSMKYVIDGILYSFIESVKDKLEQLNTQIEDDKKYIDSLKEDYTRIVTTRKSYEAKLKAYKEELKNAQKNTTSYSTSYGTSQLNSKIVDLESSIQHIDTWLDKYYPNSLKKYESSLNEAEDLKKVVESFITNLSNNKTSANAENILNTIFFYKESSFYVNLKKIANSNNFIKEASALDNYVSDWIKLYLSHYYDINNSLDFAIAVLKGQATKLLTINYFKKSDIDSILDTKDGKLYLNKYFPAPKLVSSIPEEYINAYITWLIFEFNMYGDYDDFDDDTNSYKAAAPEDVYKYCAAIIKNSKQRMDVWENICSEPSAVGLSYAQSQKLNKLFDIQPKLFESSTLVLLDALNQYIDKHF